MRVTTFLSAAAIALTASMGVSAADRAPGEAFAALGSVEATPMSDAEMDAVKGAFNLFRFDRKTGMAVLMGTHGGNFQHTPGFNNVIVGCGGRPRMTTFQNPGC